MSAVIEAPHTLVETAAAMRGEVGYGRRAEAIGIVERGGR